MPQVQVCPTMWICLLAHLLNLLPAEIIRLFKGITSRRLKKEFESLRRQYWGEHATLWAEGYYVGTAGHVSAETIKGSVTAIPIEPNFKHRRFRTFVL